MYSISSNLTYKQLICISFIVSLFNTEMNLYTFFLQKSKTKIDQTILVENVTESLLKSWPHFLKKNTSGLSNTLIDQIK